MKRSRLGPLMMDIEGAALTSEDREVLQHPLVGGLIFFTRNFQNKSQLIELIKNINSVRPDILLAADYEGGRVQRFRDEFTLIPSMRQIGRLEPLESEKAARAAGWLIGYELLETGIDLGFAPVLDLDCGVSEVIGDRAFHADPETVGRLAIAFMKGMQEAGMSSTGKHFPGHGHVSPDSHVELPVDERDFEAIDTQDLVPFKMLIAAGLSSVMMAHIRFPKVDELPASLSRKWIQEQLRQKLDFKGAIFCDDMSMGGAAAMGSYLDRAELALQAGCDMLPVCNSRHGLVELLDGLRWEISSEADARLRSLKGKKQEAPDGGHLASVQALMANIHSMT